ncbi:ABC transporter substrate-binding protein [Granulosicoccus antarcticus]|uniref:Leucine-, isoleucine-, valine-, threonine-, and alanine-binding protein n=1 Tax=Granulosicoccus antarcticus IMCC3135 TaxID=1192854 RepID=A0A2Z2NJM5_9GAMM|nr:ABC transporter substrate-binding protein [Granulosicoccus antarcticus]ASJ70705.1 Leucine-, isoleucine-, valine-, threonine-, and alanine-binding protein [Granulosicoccus antarcticus IMCC3135]
MKITPANIPLFKLSLALVGLSSFAPLSPAQAADCTTKIGAVLPTSVDWGRPIAETAQFAVELYNESGGVKGCDIEMVLRDSQADPKIGVDAAKAMVDLDKVPVLIGAVSSGVSMPILTSVTAPSGVMQMSCCSSSTAFTDVAKEGKTKGLWFRTFATTRNQAAVAARLIQERGYKSVGIFYKNDDWGQDLGKLVAADLETLGIEVTTSAAINDAQASYRAEVTSVLKTKPEALYMALYPAEGISLVREWLSLGGTQEFVAANSLKSDEFRDGVGMQYLTKLVGHDTAPPRTDSADTFTEMYKAKFDSEPNGPGLPNSYDAVMISLLAMDAAPELTGAAIAASVPRVTDPAGTPIFPDVAGLAQARELLGEGKNVSYQGATGAVVFDANGDVSAPAVAWKFSETGVEEESYFALDEVNAFIAELTK